MNYVDYFLNPTKPLVRPRFTAVEDDWNFLRGVFPEPGFRSYFLGFIVSRLADEIRSYHVTNYHDRDKCRAIADFARFLSNVRIIGHKDESDDGSTTGRLCNTDEGSPGKSADSSNPVKRQGKGGQEGRRTEETQFESTRTLDEETIEKLYRLFDGKLTREQIQSSGDNPLVMELLDFIKE